MSNYFSKLAKRCGLERPSGVRSGNPQQGRHTRPVNAPPVGIGIHETKPVQTAPATHPAPDFLDRPTPFHNRNGADALERNRESSKGHGRSKAARTTRRMDPATEADRPAKAVETALVRNAVDAYAALGRSTVPSGPIQKPAGEWVSAQRQAMSESIGTGVINPSGRSRRHSGPPGEAKRRSGHANGHPVAPIRGDAGPVRFRTSVVDLTDHTPPKASPPPESDAMDDIAASSVEAFVHDHASDTGPKPRVEPVPQEGPFRRVDAAIRPEVVDEIPQPGTVTGAPPVLPATRQPENAVDVRIGTISFEVHPAESPPLPSVAPSNTGNTAPMGQPTRSSRLSRYYLKGW